jgi:hypothetical protein
MKTKAPQLQSIDIDQLNNVLGGVCANCGGNCPDGNCAAGGAQRGGLLARWRAARG